MKVDKDYILNDPVSFEFAQVIGQIILNFGALELEIHRWIEKLTGSKFGHPHNKYRSPDSEIGQIIKLVKKQKIKNVEEGWKLARSWLKFRNIVAHNPLVFVNDQAGLVLLNDVVGGKGPPLYTLELLRADAKEIADIIEKLHKAFDEV